VVRQYVTLAASGAGFKGLCPFHREKTPSFHVSPDRQIYKCFGCDEGGDVISFLMEMEKITFPEALETLARPLDIDLARYLREDESEGERVAFHRANEVASDLWEEALWADKGQTARQYLEERGFPEDILRRYNVGFAPAGSDWFLNGLRQGGVQAELAGRCGLTRQRDGQPPFAYFYNRIIFPIKNIAQRIAGFGGRILGQGEPKYLNSSDSTFFSKGKLLYGFAASRISIARLKTAILVEGYLDLLALAQHGFGNVVATCGTAYTPDQARILRRSCRKLLVLFDGDRAGLQASIRACHTALAAGQEALIVRLPAGEDPASLLQTQDRDAMEQCLAQAKAYIPFLLALVEERGNDRLEKERALRQGLKSIALVPDPIRKEYLLQETAELFGITVDILRQQLAKEEKATRTRGQPEPTAPVGGSPLATGSEPEGMRSFTAINRPAIEATMLAHVLRDESGLAAETLLDAGSGYSFTTPAATLLGQELVAWQDERSNGRSIAPADFLQERWHQHDDSYRRLVSDLLTKEVIPDQTDFSRVIKDCLSRLRS